MGHRSKTRLAMRVCLVVGALWLASAVAVHATSVVVPSGCSPAGACECNGGNTLCWPNVPLETITFDAGNVTFDCSVAGPASSFPLGGASAGSPAVAPIVEITTSHVTIKSCIVRFGNDRGIYAHGTTDVSLTGNHIFGTLLSAITADAVGTALASTGVILRQNIVEKTRNLAQGASDKAITLTNLTAGAELTCNVVSSESSGVINDSLTPLSTTCNAFDLYGRKFVSTSFTPIAVLSTEGSGMRSDRDCVVTVSDSVNPNIPTRCRADSAWSDACDDVLAGTCLAPLAAYGAFTVPALNFDRNGDTVLDAIDENADGRPDLLDEDGDGIVDWRDTVNTGTSAGIADTDVFAIGTTGRIAAASDTEVEAALLIGVQTGLWAASQGFTNHGVDFHDNRIVGIGSRPPPLPNSIGVFSNGVLIQGADGVVVSGNTILGTNFGIVTNDAAHVGFPFVVDGNIVNGSRFWSSALAFGAIQLQNTFAVTSADNRVSGNAVFNWKGYGIAVAGGAAGAGVAVLSNLLSDVSSSAFLCQELTGTDPISVEVANNVAVSPTQTPPTEGFYLSNAAGLATVSIHDNDVLAQTMFSRGSDSYASFEVFHNIFRPGGGTPKQTDGTAGKRLITKVSSSQGNNWSTHCDPAIPAVWTDPVPAGVLSPAAVDPNAYEGTAGVPRPWDSDFEPGCFGTRPLPNVSQNTAPVPTQSKAGSKVAGAGDINRDGEPDLITGATGFTGNLGFAGTTLVEAGAALVYFGSADAAERSQPDIIFEGAGAHDRAGVSVAGDFDFNGDGFPDIVIGAEQVDRASNPGSPVATGNGKVYVIFFDPNDAVHYPHIADPAVPDVVSLSLVGQPGGVPGVVFSGVALGDQAGFSVAAGGTSTPGGGTDILIGAPGADPSGQADAGAAYVVFDSPSLSGDVPLSRISSGLPDQVPGKAYLGASAGDNVGFSTAFGGPVVQGQNQTVGTVVMGAPGANGSRGRVIAPPGDPDTTPIIVDAVGGAHSGVRINGTQPGEQLGFAVADGSDALADGVSDLLIGAPTFDAGVQTDAGRVLQTTQVIASGVYNADAVGTTLGGLIWTGEATGDQLGYAVAGVADVTGDGVADVALGAPFVDSVTNGVPQPDAGAVYLINGQAATGPLGTHSVAAVGTTIPGQELTGTQAGEHAGSSVAGTGDISGDGKNDFAVGAPDRDAAGTVYIVLHSVPPPVGECGPSGCQVLELTTGTELDVPSGGFAANVSVTVQGILDTASLPAPVPAGKLFLGAARFAPDGQAVLPPWAAILIPTVAAAAPLHAPNEVLPLYYYDGVGWALAGVDGTTGTNPSYPTQVAVSATITVLHVYAVFLNDADGDGVRDEGDNCPATVNPDQTDTNHDGTGDACQCLNVSCDDANTCTSDSCTPVAGCGHTNNANACSDGDPCTVGDVCSSGVCASGSPITAPPESASVSAPDRVTVSWASTLYATSYDVVSGTRSGASFSYAAASCLASGGGATTYNDIRANPPAGSVYWYLVRGRNTCGIGTYGSAPRDAGIPACP